MQFLAIILVAGGFSAPILANTPKVARISRPKATPTVTKKAVRRMQDANKDILNRILANSRKINELLSAHGSGPTIWEGESKILTGKTYRGILLNSVVSSNPPMSG